MPWIPQRGIVPAACARRGHIRTLQSRSDGRFTWDHGIVAHHNRAIMAVDASSPNRTVHDYCTIFYKTMFYLPLYLNSWLNREEIKRFWSKILSSLWSPCVLDLIAIQSRWDWSRIVAWFNQILPLNAERTPRTKPSISSSIRVNWSQIFASIMLVVWIDHSSCKNLYLDYI